MKLGVFGGTFDPIHNAHLFVAEGARGALALDRVVFAPSATPRHRDGVPCASLEDRLAMIRLAIASNDAFGIDDLDLAADATGYTADLVPRLRRRYAGDAITFIVGSDSVLDVAWQRFDDVVDGLDGFAIAPRDAALAGRLRQFIGALRADRAAKIHVLPLPSLAESATAVRAELARGATVRYIVPEPVWRYIAERHLYRAVP